MSGADYSEASEDARQIIVDLLDLSRRYESLEVPTGLGVATVGAFGLTARGRHLISVGCDLADRGESMVAAMATRGAIECVLILAWLHLDHELAGTVWELDEIRTRLSHHDEVMRARRRQRARARRLNEPVAPLAAGESLGLLTRAKVRELRRVRDRELAELRVIPNLQKRKRQLGLDSLSRIPSWKKISDAAGQDLLYTIPYRFDSNSAVHATPLAAEQFLEKRGDALVVRGAPAGPRPDPYVVLAVVLVVLIEYAGLFADHSDLEDSVRKLRRRMENLRPTARP